MKDRSDDPSHQERTLHLNAKCFQMNILVIFLYLKQMLGNRSDKSLKIA